MEVDYEYKITEHSIAFSLNKNHYQAVKKINKKYMIMLNDNTLYIYDFTKKIFLPNFISLNDQIHYFDFHSNNENIFFICSGKNIIIYQILNAQINNICTIEGHFIDVFYGSFNPFDANIFISISKTGFLKIYDITSSSPLGIINYTESLENVFDIKLGKNVIGFGQDDCVEYFNYINYNKDNIKKYISENIIEFYFLNDYDDSLLIIKEDKIEIVKNNIKLSTVIDNKIDINYTFYFVKKKILVIITNTHIKGIKIKDNNEIINLFVFGDNLNNKISNPIFVNENYLNDNEICRMFENHSKRKMFSILILDNTKIKQN